jgi:uncharacterized protein (DUF362 family)
MATITSANAVFMLAVPGAISQLTQLQSFGTDDAFLMNVVEATEVQVGVDGYGVAGYIPRSPRHTIRLLASSASVTIFENWIAAMDVAQDVLYANATIRLPSVKRFYTAYMGSPMNFSTMADAKKVLQNREFEIQWLPQGQTPAITYSPTL